MWRNTQPHLPLPPVPSPNTAGGGDRTRAPFTTVPLRTSLAPLLLLALLLTSCLQPQTYQGAPYNPPVAAADLALTDMQGQSFRLSEAPPGVRLVFFGYSSCPDICPNTLGKVAAALAELDAEERAAVQVLFITVDPARDSAQVLQEYLAPFGPEFLGLTGDEAALQEAAKAYFGTFYEEPEQPGLFTHSGRVQLIDRHGMIPVSYTDPFDPADLAHDLRLALR